MNKSNRRIQRPQALETLASEVRLKLAPAEKAFFDLHWHYGPHPSAEIFPDKTKGAVPAIAHKLRAKLDEFFEGPAGIQNRHRLGLTPATHDRIREIEIQENLLPAATAFW